MSLSGIAIRTEIVSGRRRNPRCGNSLDSEWVDSAELLGVPHVREVAGNLSDGPSEKQGIGRAIEEMNQHAIAAKRGITLGIEDHGGMIARASTTVGILRRVDSPYAGMNLDISNFEGKTDEAMYSDIRASVPFATHTHIRDLLGQQAADRLGPCLAAFRSRRIQGIHVRGI
jgi:sugar phosphate isomerase/epimerase